MKAMVPAVALVALFAAAVPESVRAQAPTLALETWLDWERVSDPRISPDGSAVVYTRGWVDKINDRWDRRSTS